MQREPLLYRAQTNHRWSSSGTMRTQNGPQTNPLISEIEDKVKYRFKMNSKVWLKVLAIPGYNWAQLEKEIRIWCNKKSLALTSRRYCKMWSAMPIPRKITAAMITDKHTRWLSQSHEPRAHNQRELWPLDKRNIQLRNRSRSFKHKTWSWISSLCRCCSNRAPIVNNKSKRP